MSAYTECKMSIVCDGCDKRRHDIEVRNASLARVLLLGEGWTTLRSWGQPVRDLCPRCSQQARDKVMDVLGAHQAASLIGNRAPTPQEVEAGVALEPAARECLARYGEEPEESGI